MPVGTIFGLPFVISEMCVIEFVVIPFHSKCFKNTWETEMKPPISTDPKEFEYTSKIKGEIAFTTQKKREGHHKEEK